MENESEKLLENLLNLEQSLLREKNLRTVFEALLKGLRGINDAHDTESLFNILVEVLHSVLEFDDAFILQSHHDGTLTPIASTSPIFNGSTWHQFSLFRRVLSGTHVAVFDTNAVPEWTQTYQAIRVNIRSALHIGLNDGLHGSILVCTHQASRHFGPSHVKLAGYFAPLASQALKSLLNLIKLRQSREDMLRAQKLESLGILAGGIAHDFNNILMVILGNISLARKQANKPLKITERLVEAERAAIKAKDLAKQLLTFSKGGEPVKTILNINDLLKEAAGFAIHGTAVKCEFELSENLCPVEADEGQLSQVIHNLVLNAVQSMPEGGTVKIQAVNQRSESSGKNQVMVSITDSGSGIPEEHLQKIFDPFFTTKDIGSGLGLATCHSIIKKHDGNIYAVSTRGIGSTFYVLLPASDLCKTEQNLRTADIAHGSGAVLVMDDEPMVRGVVKAMLEELGYTVECTENSATTVALYQKRITEGKPFSAVILDLTIPGEAGGSETISLLKRVDPCVRAVVSSGYASSGIISNYRNYGFCAVISKPYRLEEISRVMHETILFQL